VLSGLVPVHRFPVTAHDAGAEVAAAAVFQNVLQAQRAEIETQGGFGFFRQGGIVPASEVLAPVNVDVRFGTTGQADKDKLFLQHLLDLQPWPILG
jgi:hypothetical protein